MNLHRRSIPFLPAKVEELIHELKKEYTIVIVTHNMQQAARSVIKPLSSTWVRWWNMTIRRRFLQTPAKKPLKITLRGVSDDGGTVRKKEYKKKDDIMVKFIESELTSLKKEVNEMWTLVYNQLDRAGESVLTFNRDWRNR